MKEARKLLVKNINLLMSSIKYLNMDLPWRSGGRWGWAVSLILTLLSTLSTPALTFNVTYDTSVTSLPNAAQEEAALAL